MDYQKQRAREQRRRRALGWREDGVRCGGMCTHSEVLLQRVSILLLQVDRKEVGRGCDSDGNGVHTWTMRHGDISMPNNKDMKKHGSKMQINPFKNGGFGSSRLSVLSVKKLTALTHQQQKSTNVQQKTYHFIKKKGNKKQLLTAQQRTISVCCDASSIRPHLRKLNH